MAEDDVQELRTNAGSLVFGLRSVFHTGETKTIVWRDAQLAGIGHFVTENEEAIINALHKDLGKPRIESLASEIVQIKTVVRNARSNLKKWTRPTNVSTNLTNLPASCFTIPQPLGVVLIISPFNFPFLLAMEPLVGAIAAGNTVVLKPSENSGAVAEILSNVLPNYIDSAAIKVVEGGVAETSALLEQKWDKIFYTGSSHVGRIVAMAAAKHLTPVILELGGKSPAIVDSQVDLRITAQRIAFGKFLNGGQACVGVDYVLVDETIASKFIDALTEVLREWYGEEGTYSPDMSRLVNSRQFDRVADYLSDPEVKERITFGGKTKREDNFISPTIIRDAPWESRVMKEEIFGPILPVQSVSCLEDAISIVNGKPKPLALYVFSKNKDFVRRVLEETSSGGVCVNDTMMHVSNQGLPFGGVGESGYGSYHGKFSFEAFSHTRSVMQKDFGFDVPAKFPPYNKFKENLISALLSGDVLGALWVLLGLRK